MEGFGDLKKAYRISAIIGIAIVASFFFYAIIVEFVRVQYKPFKGFGHLYDTRILEFFFYGLAVVHVLILRISRGVLLKKSASDDVKALIGKLFRSSVLTSALCEGPVIYGLVFFLLTGFSRNFYILLFVSLFIMFMFFPRFKNWERWVKENSKQNCFSCS